MLSVLPGISIISPPAVEPALDSTRRTGVLFAAAPGELKPTGVSIDVSGTLSADLNTMYQRRACRRGDLPSLPGRVWIGIWLCFIFRDSVLSSVQT